MHQACLELGQLGGNVVSGRKEDHLLEIVAGLPLQIVEDRDCMRQTTSSFEDITARAIAYHAAQIRGKVAAREVQSNALNSITPKGARSSRRNVPGQGREQRGGCRIIL